MRGIQIENRLINPRMAVRCQRFDVCACFFRSILELLFCFELFQKDRREGCHQLRNLTRPRLPSDRRNGREDG